MKRKSSNGKNKVSKKAKSTHNAVDRVDVWPPIVDKANSTGAEKKYRDIDTTVINVSTTGSITLLNGMARGTDAASERVGRKIVITSVFVRGYASTEISQVGTPGGPLYSVAQMVRCLIVYDKQPNGATPTLVTILKEARPESQLNINERDRFAVLADWDYAFGPAATNNTSPTGFADRQAKAFKLYRGGLRMPVIFNSNNNGDITDINTGALFMVWVGNVAAGTSTDSNARVSARVRYLDA